MYKLTITSTGETPSLTLWEVDRAVQSTEQLFYTGSIIGDKSFRLERSIEGEHGTITIVIEPVEESAGDNGFGSTNE